MMALDYVGDGEAMEYARSRAWPAASCAHH
jgi:hypothetical protein